MGSNYLIGIPKFALTEEGCVLLASLQKIRAIEGGIAESLNGQGKEVSGRVTLGIPMSRYTEIVTRHPRPIQGGI